MHPQDILMYGHTFVTRTLDPFPKGEVYRSGACGFWSVKDLVAHLSSYELVLVDVVGSLMDHQQTPNLDQYFSQGIGFNDTQVEARQEMTYDQVLEEYFAAHQQVRKLVSQLPANLWAQTGLLDWYGKEYDLEDFIVYQYYGHKREHCGQIQVFSDQFK